MKNNTAILSAIFFLGIIYAPQVSVNKINGDTSTVILPETGNLYSELSIATNKFPQIGQINTIVDFAIGEEKVNHNTMIEEKNLDGKEITMVETTNERLILPFLSEGSNWTIVLHGDLSAIRIPSNHEFITLNEFISVAQKQIFTDRSKMDKTIKMQNIMNFEDLFLNLQKLRYSMHSMQLEGPVSYHLKQVILIQQNQDGFQEYILSIKEDLSGIKPTNSFSVICDLEHDIFEEVTNFQRSIKCGMERIFLLLQDNKNHKITQESLDGQALIPLMGDLSYMPQAWELVNTTKYPSHALFHGNLLPKRMNQVIAVSVRANGYSFSV